MDHQSLKLVNYKINKSFQGVEAINQPQRLTFFQIEAFRFEFAGQIVLEMHRFGQTLTLYPYIQVHKAGAI